MRCNHALRSSLSIISAFGIELRQLKEEDIPLLCYWRNQPEIRSFMGHDRIISQKALQVWLRIVSVNDKFWPYIAYLNGKPIAFTELKYVDYSLASCEDGIFLFGKSLWGTGLSCQIILCRELIMKALGLQTQFSKVHKDNIRSIHFCSKYGGELLRTEGCFHIYKYEFKRRRTHLCKIAATLQMSDSFERFLGMGLDESFL